MSRSSCFICAQCLVVLLGSFAVSAAGSPTSPDTVVILHGLGRTRWSMAPLASALTRDGYRVVNLTYPSRGLPLETLAHDWLPAQLRAHGIELATTDEATPRLHFVTHSMGGILVRLWLRDGGVPARLGRVVMLSPPNAGSELTDRLNAFPPFRWFTGKNGRRLGTRDTDLPQLLGPWPAEASLDSAALGVIAADRSLNPLFSAWLPGPDDGKVTVVSTRLAGMRDHIVLHHSHTWLAWRTDTASQVRAFLRDGRFQHAE